MLSNTRAALCVLAAMFLAASAFSQTTDPVARSNEIVAERMTELENQRGPAETYTYGAITDDENNRELFRVASKISDLTGLDFVALASIQQLGGEVELYSVATTLPGDLPGKDDMLRILARSRLRHFEPYYYEAYFKDYPQDDTAAFSQAVADEVWLAFREEYGDLSDTDPEGLAEKYPAAKKAADLTGLDIIPLSGVLATGGYDGLSKLLMVMPEELPGKHEAIGEVADERRKSR
ncbi:MAG: hypothetical protein JW885_10750 [Deltaproteobacteria bacterium]|nr:hypothetical protein [Candidatus Zymogenaceae bacterium]